MGPSHNIIEVSYTFQSYHLFGVCNVESRDPEFQDGFDKSGGIILEGI